MNTVTYFSFHFINVLSYWRCIRYLVFHRLFPSIGMADIDYTCIKSVSEYSKSIRLLLKLIKVPYGARLHYFYTPMLYRLPAE